jgi:3-oxoacyl-[acyl-carrier-protein] synthase II
MLGASGAIEFIACLLALREGFLPPTIHYEKPDPECDLDYIPNHSRKACPHLSCSISMGFGGHLGAILIMSNP